MKAINIHAAKTHRSRLVDEAAAGADIVIAKAGKPLVRLVPVTGAARRRGYGAMKGKIRMSASFDAPMPAAVARAFGIKK